MCGITGVLNADNTLVNKELLMKMSLAIAHRGPDDFDLFIDHSIGLAFRRLSIIDVDTGHQPMRSADGRYVIVFNGEIYNYIELREELENEGVIFRTESDTEVLMASYIEWGADCLHRINGMFAFAIWDTYQKELFFARDRLGIKPFYYLWDGNRFIFASEIKSILMDNTVDRKPNYSAIKEYLQFSFLFGDKTFFEGIQNLEPGYYGMFTKENGVRIDQYWDLNKHSENQSEQFYKDMLNETLHSAVKLHLRSDVPIGTFLSGGLDSSIVTTLAAKFKPDIMSFTGKYTEEPMHDESKYAKIVADHSGVKNMEVTPSSAFEILPKLIWHMDEPAAGPGIIPQYHVSRLASAHVKVVLGGQGGDELFGGYNRYFIVNNRMRGDIIPSSQLMRYIRIIRQQVSTNGLKNTIIKIKDLMKRKGSKNKFFSDIWFQACTSANLPESSFGTSLDKISVRSTFDNMLKKLSTESHMDSMMHFDIKYYLPSLLQVEDRTSMAVSMESRLPMLDYRVVELALKIPSGIKLSKQVPKYILKETAKPFIPKEIYNRKDKLGFPTPIHRLFAEHKLKIAALLGERFMARGIIKPEYVKRYLKNPQLFSRQLWLLLNVELWFEIFIDKDQKYIDSNGLFTGEFNETTLDR